MDPMTAPAPRTVGKVAPAKPVVSRRVAAELELSHTHTESSVKHSALGTFTSFRLVDDRDGYRVRAAAVCLRTVEGLTHGMEQEVCLISSSSRSKPGTWKLPGGGVEKGEAPCDAVLREVVEEAGLKGRVIGCMGVYQNDAKKTRTQWFVVEVTREMATWEEGELGRKRKWHSVADALQVLPTAHNQSLLREACAVRRAIRSSQATGKRGPPCTVVAAAAPSNAGASNKLEERDATPPPTDGPVACTEHQEAATPVPQVVEEDSPASAPPPSPTGAGEPGSAAAHPSPSPADDCDV